MIIGLVGGTEIAKYSIADVLWRKISELSRINFGFKIISVENFTELCRFYWSYYENKDFIGFNVALPWKTEIIKLVDLINSESKIYNSVNVVYKKGGEVRSSNTDIVGIEKALLNVTNIKGKRVLILGEGGAGFPTSIYLSTKYNCAVYVYDVKVSSNILSPVRRLYNYEDVTENVYDIIINATPVGKYYLDKIPFEFSLPLSLDMLQRITHDGSIIQEMNYFPFNTQLMKFGQLNNITVVSGVDMLVYQALETFKLYTGYEFNKSNFTNLIDYIKEYSINKEHELLRKNPTDSGSN